MEQRLSEDRIRELLPVLPVLAKHISKEGAPDRDFFVVALNRVGLHEAEWAFFELAVWAKVLVKAREGSEDNIGDYVHELQDRLVPIAYAVLACKDARPEPMSVRPQFVDVGPIDDGKDASATVTVSGSDLSRVSSKFGKVNLRAFKSSDGNTIIRLLVGASKPGTTVSDEVVLRGSHGEVTVPVSFRWKDAPQEPPLLSWCPKCGDRIGKKSLFFNTYTRGYECLNRSCNCKFPFPDARVAEYNRKRI